MLTLKMLSAYSIKEATVFTCKIPGAELIRRRYFKKNAYNG
jgi:hypothetical protein